MLNLHTTKRTYIRLKSVPRSNRMQAKITVNPSLEHDNHPVGLISISSSSSTFRKENRTPLNLVCVIDTSASMVIEGKLELVKATLDFVTDHLSEKDKMSVVYFGSDADVVFGLLAMRENNRRIAKHKIRNMLCGGCTNLSGGILLGLELISQDLESLEDSSTPPNYSLMLFTDGAANRGIIEMPDLIHFISSAMNDDLQLKSCTNIYTFGFGADHDVKMLESISDITVSGSYYYINSRDAIGPQFIECLGGLLSLAAQNITLNIESGEELGYTLPKLWATKKVQNSTSTTVSLGDLYFGQQRNVVFTFKSESHLSFPKCTLSYFDVVKGKWIKDILVNETESMDIKLIKQNYHRVIVAECIRHAISTAERDLESAKAQISEKLIYLKENDCEAILIEDLEKCLKVMKHRDRYEGIGRATLSTMSLSHENQRSSHYTTEYQNGMMDDLLACEAYKSVYFGPEDAYSDSRF